MGYLRTKVFVILAALALPLAGAAAVSAQPLQPARLLRFPDIHGSQIVFSYAGDLWTVSSDGGVARRLTTSRGLELFPKFSPDGRWIAFTAQYDGNFNVYVMPSDGSAQPRQLTYVPDIGPVPERMGPNNEVIAWTPDSKRIVFLSRRDTFNTWFGNLWTVSVDGGLPERLPIDRGGLLAFNADGSEMIYNRIFRNFRAWKRYTGGMAQKLSLWNFKTHQYEQLTHDAYTDTYPMWTGGDIVYFCSDRGTAHRLNLYSLDLNSHTIRQLTHFTDFDVEWPSLNGNHIVFQYGGWLYLFNTKTDKSRKLTIETPGDFPLARKHWENTAKLIDSFDVSPDGERAAFSARGEIYTAPASHGSILNLTETPGIRRQDVAWSPDGKWLAYVSDRSGEQQLYIRPQDGFGAAEQITHRGTAFLMPPEWSPDSTKLLYANSSLQLFYVDIHQKKPVLIDTAKYGEITRYSWSPDSEWVGYARMAVNDNRAIELYSLADHKITQVVSSFTDNTQPIFDPEGKYLYFLSDRTYNEVLGPYDMDFSNPKATRIYAITLRADEPSPFAPRDDEEEEDPKPADTANAQKKPEKTPFRVDFAGIASRVVPVPTPPGNYGNLAAAAGRIYYLSEPTMGLSGPLPGAPPAIHVFNIKTRKDQEIVIGVEAFTLSFDGKKLLYESPVKPPGKVATYGIVSALPTEHPLQAGAGAINLSTMRADIDPPAEWKQMFNEAWRQYRTYFFEKSMNGVDWPAVREKYAALLPYVADRYDLNYIISEMIAELSNSHTYVGGGDFPNLHPVNVGMLGVDFRLDPASGRYQMAQILKGDNWNPADRSPLTEPGVNVHAGDYLLAVNGHDLRAPENPYKSFVNTANQVVTLTVNSKPTMDGARKVMVKPLANEYQLRLLHWIHSNRERVAKMSGGKIGYVYLSDMEDVGLNQFVHQFFPQIRKEGIIFDIRYNGGGFVDQIILERLRRILAGMELARNWKSNTVPQPVFYGYMACVTNHYAASDGDFFSYYFKYYKLGPLIGTRTWGGVRGIRGYIPLMDGGYITRPEFSLYNLHSQWIIENHGVEPNIVVRNTPDQVMAGHDPQLEKAVEVLMKEIQAHPMALPKRPPDLPAYPQGPG